MFIKDLQWISSQVAQKEGKKSQVKIGDVREVISCLIQLEVEYAAKGEKGPLETMYQEAQNKIKGIPPKPKAVEPPAPPAAETPFAENSVDPVPEQLTPSLEA